MRRFVLIVLWSGCFATVVGAGSFGRAPLVADGQTETVRQSQARAAAANDASQYRDVLKKYCVTCHSARLRTGGLTLEEADPSNVEQHEEFWEKVVGKLRAGDMPPAGRPRPDAATYTALISRLETSLDAAASKNPQPGRPMLHRLNRTEYANAVRDLLDLDVDVKALLPADDSTHGFDNIADALNVSPLLLESYVVAARKISRIAVGNPSIPAFTETHVAAHDETQDFHEAGMPFGTRGGLRVRQHFPATGEYEIRIKLERSHLLQIRGLQEPHDLELAIDGKPIKLFQLDGGPHMYAQKVYDGETPSLAADEHLHVRVPVTAGPHEVRATFRLKTSAIVEGLSKPLVRSYYGPNSVDGMPAVSKIMVTGPFDATRATDTPTRARIFTCHPTIEAEEQACAKAILSTLARRAYRGLSTDAAVKELLRFFAAGRQNGGFEAGIEMALQRVLAGPEFIYRFEVDPATVAPGSVYRISDRELASRLSFFLWSSIPDGELLDLAARGQLKQPPVLAQQVRRMLRDERARALVDNFAGQWLYLRNLDSVVPDPRVYPEFDNNLRRAFRRETELLFETIMREDRSVVDFLDADFTFVDERLALHYGIPNLKGSDFQRVTIADPNRRGLLGHASILTVTSYANRTSPVLRGKWILENILGTPPPAPPANVPALDEKDSEAGKVLTMRERMARHRANPVCASCHAKMDPIGFGMETFDATGAWRATEGGGVPIDTSGVLPNGTGFHGPAELRQSLMQHPEAFVGTLTAKLLTYALGRGIEYFDAPAVRKIVRSAERSRYSFSSIVLGIVNSVPFQMRQAGEETPTAQQARRR